MTIETKQITVFIGPEGRHYESKQEAAFYIALIGLKQIWHGDVHAKEAIQNAAQTIAVLQKYLEDVE